jgi:hypothetical protein
MAGTFWWTQGVDVFAARKSLELAGSFIDLKTF